MAARCRRLVVLCAVLQLNEAFGSVRTTWTVASKAEIAANMTSEVAARIVLGMNRTLDDPEFLALIRSRFGSLGRRGLRMKEQAQLQVSFRGATNPTGYSGVEKAKMMLNEMSFSAQTELDGSVATCNRFDRVTTIEMETMRQKVSDFNANAANARGRVIHAQGQIATLGSQLISTTEAFERHKRECKEELEEMNRMLKIILNDVEVMEGVLKLTDCGDEEAQEFLLVQCKQCSDAIYLQHTGVAKLLGKLQSNLAKQSVQQSLDATLHDSQPVVLTQKDVSRFRIRDAFAVSPIPVGGINTSDVPSAPEPFDCQSTSKCALTAGPSCERLKDRFLGVQAGIVDQRDELEEGIFNKQKFCNDEDLRYTQEIDNLNEMLRKQQVDLSTATKDQNTAEKGSHQQSGLHEKTAISYTQTMSDCCATQNEKKSEMCALEKIRGELDRMEGTKIFTTDCTVSEWAEQECSATCGGGFAKKIRKVIVQPSNGGVHCPPLEASDSCNEAPCPIDCKLGLWGGWSSCSAECGGGVQEKSRNILVMPEHGGAPCGETEDEKTCHIQDCSQDCKLSKWTPFTGCSKACGGGTQQRHKTIRKQATGDGKCWGAQDPERWQFRDCNKHSCQRIIPPGRTILNCNSKVDVVILLDGSASLGRNGWTNSKKLAGELVTAFEGGEVDAKVALLVFSGPKTWPNLLACQAGRATNLKTQCGMEWIKHLQDTTDDLADRTADLTWPRSSTLTSVALGQAESEMVYGREDANSVTIVITDGKPFSEKNTKTAARDLELKSKVVWVPVGRGISPKLIEAMASKPFNEHIIYIDSIRKMAKDSVVNDIITNSCPVVS